VSKRRKRPSGDPRKRAVRTVGEPKVYWAPVAGAIQTEVTANESWREQKFGDDVDRALKAFYAQKPSCHECGSPWDVFAHGPYASDQEPGQYIDLNVFCRANSDAHDNGGAEPHDEEPEGLRYMVSLDDLSVEQVWFDE
jgi:hypothetical protein